jgi:hypothetical protein
LLIDVRIGGATAAEVAAVQPILDRRRQGRSGLRTRRCLKAGFLTIC